MSRLGSFDIHRSNNSRTAMAALGNPTDFKVSFPRLREIRLGNPHWTADLPLHTLNDWWNFQINGGSPVMTAEQHDAVLIQLAASKKTTGGWLAMNGHGAGRTAASDAAFNKLVALGVIITIN
jgi:hypothetical protein